MVTILNYFIFFILGIVFCTLIYPLLDALCAVFLSALEILKGYCTVKITELNNTINKMSEPEPQHTHVIGFQIPSEEDEYYEEEEDDDD